MHSYVINDMIPTSNLQAIIRDEISMVGYRMDRFCNQRLQEAKGCDDTYGGLHVIDFGDFYQLSPVGDSYFFGKYFNDSQVETSSVCLTDLSPHPWKDMKMIELTEVMRQKGDMPFINALNHMRDGSATEENCWKEFKDRFTTVTGTPPLDCPSAAYTNKRVNELNEQARLRCPLPEIQIQAKDAGADADNLENVEFLVHRASTMKRTDTGGLEALLKLRRGMVVEITRNINKGDGLVNGSDGILKEWTDLLLDSSAEAYTPQGILWVEFFDPCVGKETRRQNHHLFQR